MDSHNEDDKVLSLRDKDPLDFAIGVVLPFTLQRHWDQNICIHPEHLHSQILKAISISIGHCLA